MTTYPIPLSPTPALTDEANLETAVDCLVEHLPLEVEGGYTPQDLFEILLRAASCHDSIEHTSQRLQGVPSGNGIRYHLDKFEDMKTVEQQLNAALQSRLPEKIHRGKLAIAIDLHLLPYYGNPSEVEVPYVYRSQAKAGTTSFFAYATVYVICRYKRVTLAIHAIHRQETLVATVTYLLAMLTPLKVRVKRLYLDRGFYSVPVIRWLKALNIPFLIPADRSRQNRGHKATVGGAKVMRRATTSRVVSMVRSFVRCGWFALTTKGSRVNMGFNRASMSYIESRLPCLNCISITSTISASKPVTDSKNTAVSVRRRKIL